MTRRVALGAALIAAAVLCVARPASADPLGTFRWQLQPYCNILTFTVTQHESVFTLDGYDDQCGAATRAPAVGIATLNPNGTVEMGVTVLTSPHGQPRHLDATVSLVTVSGTWRWGSQFNGPLAFNAATGGIPMPAAGANLEVTGFSSTPFIRARRAQGTPTAPAAVLSGQTLAFFTGEGYNGQDFDDGGSMLVQATQNWTPTAQGARILFSTSEDDTGFSATRMTILGNGNVGINTTAPSQRLHVNGNARIGSCTYESDGDVVCFSDARYKRDVQELSPMLDRVTALRPVRYGWRPYALADHGPSDGASTGLVAQEVERVLPELVTTDADGYKSVNYGRLPLLAVQSIKELKARHDALEERNVDLGRRLAELEAALATLTAALEAKPQP